MSDYFAFPFAPPKEEGYSIPSLRYPGPQQGMSLRDWFAAFALANPRTHLMSAGATPADVAMLAYGLADEMLKERLEI